MGIVKDELFNRYGRLEVRNFVGYKGKHVKWNCLCDCGSYKTVTGVQLRKGRVKSCGCLALEARIVSMNTLNALCDGRSKHQYYNIFINMHRRCYDIKSKDYKYYGARGITVCSGWHDFWKFVSDLPPRPSLDHSIDRVNNNEGYSVDNVHWATHTEQMNNTRLREAV